MSKESQDRESSNSADSTEPAGPSGPSGPSGSSGADASGLIALLDTFDQLPAARRLRLLSYELLTPDPASVAPDAPDAHVVDVGCGAGRAVAELTERGTRVTGVDLDLQMIEVARQRWPKARFETAGAYELPFADASLTGYRADKLYHDLDHPDRALAEARRVLAPGGRVVLIGQDWDTFVVDADDPALTRTMVHARADRVTHPRAARRYRGWLLDAGFTDVQVDVHTGVFTDELVLPMMQGFARMARDTGAISDDEADGWLADQRQRAADDRLFMAIPLFVASATRA
ncbi:methyltransferase domain-containing protein [Streptomyces sp. NBC_01304]|uniref:methyltransferase domain-containing protein n=1 Tax=Streptomyces sp. NBC_01304 TaxID=2903818 RepID=UPI002E11BCF8